MQYLAAFVSIFIELISFAIIGRVLFSWLGPEQKRGRFYYLLVEMTDPILQPLQRMMPQTGMIDFSPLIALIALDILKRVILSLI